MGNLIAAISQAYPPKPKWTPDLIPDLTDKVIIITGGNSGIGKETARELLAHNAKIYIATRSAARAADAIEELKKATGKGDDRIQFLKLDLTDLGSIKAAADEFTSKESRLDVLMNNGGVMIYNPDPANDIERVSPSGLEIQFATTAFGHFYLTQLLLPLLIASAKTSPDKKARVVYVSSISHLWSPKGEKGPIDYDTIVDGPVLKATPTAQLYSQASSAKILLSSVLARRYADQGIVSVAVHPGAISTPIFRSTTSIIKRIGDLLFLSSPWYGMLSPAFAATTPEPGELNGKYLIPWARVGAVRPDHTDVAKQDQLWTWLEEKVKELAP